MTKQREKYVVKRVEFWQAWLEPLGVAHWKIGGIELNDAPDHSPFSNACVHNSMAYATCWFEFRNEFINQCFDELEGESLATLDRVILHEWVHVAFRDYYKAISSIEDEISPPLLRMWTDRLEQANEGLVENLARALYQAFEADVVL